MTVFSQNAKFIRIYTPKESSLVMLALFHYFEYLGFLLYGVDIYETHLFLVTPNTKFSSSSSCYFFCLISEQAPTIKQATQSTKQTALATMAIIRASTLESVS